MPRPLDLLVFNWMDRTHPLAGGAETNLHEVFGRLVSRGHTVTLIVSSFPGASAHEVLDGMDVWRCGNHWSYPVAARARYQEQFRDRAFDVVIEDLNKIPLGTPLWVRQPLVLFVHHLFGASAFAAVNPLVAIATMALEHVLLPLYTSVPVVAVSASSAAEARLRTRHRDEVHVIHNGAADREEAVTRAPGHAHEGEFLYVGRLQRYKRVDLCVRALARLAHGGVSARLTIVGRGPEEHRLRALAHALGISQLVDFRGFVDDEEKQLLMARALANVITSVKEGWGMSILDAAVHGTPSIASDSPGLRDAVRDGTTGLLVPHGDVEALAAAMQRVATDRVFAQALGDNARAHAMAFTWDAAAEAFEALLHTVAVP